MEPRFVLRMVSSERRLAMDIGLNGLRNVMNWGGWTRTTNFLINSQAICQLIYAPSVWHFRSFFPP